MITMLFAGGLVFDGLAAPVPGHGVLVADGRIRAVAPLATFDGFAGPRVDTTGGTLMPGLIDCHTHLSFAPDDHPDVPLRAADPDDLAARVRERALATLAGGITAIRDCGGLGAPEYRVRDGFAVTGDGPLIQACGPMIRKATDGFGDTVAHVAADGAAMAAAVREIAEGGADFINIMATMDGRDTGPGRVRYHDAEIATGIAAARAADRPVASNAQCAEDIAAVARAGAASVEQGSGLDDEAIAAMLANDVVLVPILWARHNMFAAMVAAGAPAQARDAAEALAERTRRSARDYARAGGRIAMGTDCGAPGSAHGGNAGELALLVQAGLTPLQALRAATAHGAALMRLADRGRIAPGAAADLLLVDGDPGADIARAAERRHHRMVLLAGRPVTRH